ncbi:hypothetical protein B566_EDAN002270 [Ephemera danica]|nr:hypothetical protein B566_EDAN002270 [Ephemera danica]
MSHVWFCGVDGEERQLRMWKCEVCGRCMLPASRYSHENTHKQSTDQDVLENVDDESYETCGYKKHQEVPKVNKVLQDTWLRQLIEHGVIKCRYAGCDFTATNSLIMQQHCDNDCSMKPSEDSDREHSEAEAGESSSDDDVGMTETPANFSNKRQARTRLVTGTSQHFYTHSHCCSLCIAYNLNFMAQFCSYRGKIPYRPVIRWMMERHSQNCPAPISFPSLLKLNKSIVAQMENLNDYLPETKQSIQFGSKKLLDISQVYKWQSLPMFSGCVDEGVPTLFTGGPIIAMSWCPTPLGKLCEQFLAVTCHPSMDSTPNLGQVSEAPGMVQLWSMGALSNSPDSAKTPHLILGLCHKWGTVRQLIWCPIGCWDSEKHQYGLLAAACADGTVKIFPIGKLDACKRQFTKAQVTLTLLPYSLSHRKSPCLRVAWHTGTAQDVIAGGFANGLVCLWKISGYSQLLRHSMDGVECLFPYFRFQPHCGPITALELSPLESGEPRFLFTGCITEKSMAYWDLDKQCEFSVGTYPRRSRVISSTWMTSWPHAIVGLEDVHQGATALPIRNFTRHMMYLPQNSSTMSVDKGDWLNGVVQGTSAGEISLALIAQMIFGMDTEKNHKIKRALLSRTTRTSIASSSEVESFLTYSEASKRKLMFHDIVLDSDRPWCEESKAAQSQDTMDTVSSMNYPLTAVNKVAWNPNWQSFGWIAAGYQCGLVRLLFLRCKSSDLLVKDCLNKKLNVS